MTDSLQTDRTTVKRLPNRGVYDRETVNAILDEALICHVGFVVEGKPVVIPTIQWRDGETLYIHGSAASRMLRTLRAGVDACVTVTLLDGLVLARSAFNHSMNYRSVVVYGRATEVTDPAEKARALHTLVEHVVKGRSAYIRPPNESELRQTMVLTLPIAEASAKVRSGGAVDEDEDYELPIWAGVLPLPVVPGAPISDDRLAPEIRIPENVVRYLRR